jgi:uncharacterized repeat protein (TIGR01451 family)
MDAGSGNAMKQERGCIRAIGARVACAVLGLTANAVVGASGFSDAAAMNGERVHATATLLPLGRVLVAGGRASESGTDLASTEIYDTALDAWTPTVPMSVPRAHHAAVLLASGGVLMTGASSTTEIFDESTSAWLPAASTQNVHVFNTASLLASGRVLVFGADSSSETFDPTADAWSLALAPDARASQTASVLDSGRVLIAGGDLDGAVLSSALSYDPANNTWMLAAPLAQARTGHTAIVLPSGKVLVAGGMGEAPAGYLASSEIYDPMTDTWSPGPDMTLARFLATATRLQSGQVLVAGGYTPDGSVTPTAEIYDPFSNTFYPIEVMHFGRSGHTATLLSSGRVLLVGGEDGDGVAQSSAEVYSPPTWLTIDASAPDPSVTQQWFQASFSVHDLAGTPTGSVIVSSDEGVNCGPVMLVDGAGACTLVAYAVGTHTLTAFYMPDDGAFMAATTTASHVVDRAATLLTLSILDNPIDPDAPLRVRAFLDVAPPGGGTPTGTIVVQRDDGASCEIDPGFMIECLMPPAAVGTHLVEATYAGDDNYLGSEATASYEVYAFDTTTFITSVSPEPSQVGQEVAVVFEVESLGAPATGTVTVTADITGETCTAAVAVGSCTLVFHSDGARALTASYSGDAAHLSSESLPWVHDVVEANTSLTITSHTPDPSLPFETVTVSVELTVLPPGSGSPHSSISVSDGIDGCTIPEGGTSCDLVLTTRGPRTITALYGGDGDFNPCKDEVTHHVNQLPIVADRSYATLEETTLEVDAASGVLSGASDPDGDPLVIANPGTFDGSNLHGTIELHEDGSFVYTPPPGLAGKDQFGFLVSDGYEIVGATATIVVGASAGLSVTIDDGTTFVAGGGAVQYTIVVANAGPAPAAGARVADPVPANLSGVTWTCVASAGAACSAQGSGDIDDIVDLPPGAVLTYVMIGTVATDPEIPLANTANVHAPAGTTDTNPLDDSASDVDTVGVFADGFDTAGAAVDREPRVP